MINSKFEIRNLKFFIFISASSAALFFGGCKGYSNLSLYPQDVKSIYVEMFDNETFRRDLEYDLTDAIAKRIESETPYKIISDKNRADTVLSGKITAWNDSVLSLHRDTGRAMEEQADVTAKFSWKNLKTGEYILENSTATASASFSQFQSQGFDYASKVAANRLAERIVEQMQLDW